MPRRKKSVLATGELSWLSSARAPHVLGSELAGEIVAVGSDVRGRTVGGQPLEGMRMAGGHRLRLLDLRPTDEPFLMPNITPDEETGIGAWTDEQIRVAIQDGIRPDGSKLAPQGPAEIYHDMTPTDVAAIIAYLRTIPAVHDPAAVRSARR